MTKHQTHELLFGDPLQVIELSRTSQEFFLLQRIQDEVHRFHITFTGQFKNSSPPSWTASKVGGPKRKQLLRSTSQVAGPRLKEATIDDRHSRHPTKAVAGGSAKLQQGKPEEASPW